jgi:putative hydrolase of the HAD superfamily
MLRWIAFDAVGTLITPEPSVAAAYHSVGQRYGSRVALEEMRTRFRRAFRASEQEDGADATACGSHKTSEHRERRRWRRIVRDVIDDSHDPESCFDDLWAHFAAPANWRCFPETEETLIRLRRAGYRLAIASNFDARLHAVCKGIRPLEPVERTVVSSEVGYRKPGAGFYAALLRDLECAPDEVLMVGDDWVNDIVGARAAGLSAAFLLRNGESPPPESLGSGVPCFRTLDELASEF